MTRGRPPGHVRLLDDDGRFEIAAWLAFTKAGMAPYPAAYLGIFLITSDRPITTKSVDDVLLMSSTPLGVTIRGHADRVRRKAPEAIERADENERAWLDRSSGLLRDLWKFFVGGDGNGFVATVDGLSELGWADTLLRISGRIEASLLNDFPLAKGRPSRAAARLLRLAKK